MTGFQRVRLTGWVALPPHRRQAVLAALPAHIRATRAEPGCLSFDVWLDPATQQRLIVNEVFANRAALDAHGARLARTEWAKRTAGLDRNYSVTPVLGPR